MCVLIGRKMILCDVYRAQKDINGTVSEKRARARVVATWRKMLAEMMNYSDSTDIKGIYVLST